MAHQDDEDVEDIEEDYEALATSTATATSK